MKDSITTSTRWELYAITCHGAPAGGVPRSINPFGLKLTTSLVGDLLQARLFLSPPIIDMADRCAPQMARESQGSHDRLKKMFERRSQSTPPSRVNLPPADSARAVATMMTDVEEAAKIRAKYTHFRILVIGRANAGKTTLLKRVCNTKEDPVYSKVLCPLPLIPH